MPKGPGLLWACAGVSALLVLVGGCTAPDYDLDSTSSRLCDDGLRNGSETDIDCGGSDCPKCVIGMACRQDSDCAYGTCTARLCQADHCANGIMDGDEEGLDCGGEECPACDISDICSNGRQDDGETDIDCGGPDCSPCEAKNCTT